MVYEYLFGDKEKSRILARVVAHLMGDGCVSKKYFAYYNKNQTLIDNFEKDVKYIFDNVHVIKGKVRSGAMLRMVQNKPIHTFLKTILPDYRSFSLYLPQFIDTEEKKIEFLKAIYDDEGCVALRIHKKTSEIKRNITLSSNSIRLLEEIKVLMKKDFDIESNKLQKVIKNRNNKVFTNYILAVSGRSNLIKFRDRINFYHPEKTKKLEVMINSYKRLASTT